MEENEKEYVKLKIGLSIKKIIDEKKAIAKENKDSNLKYKRFINSYVKLATYSGVSKTIVLQIVKGRKNAAITTIIAMIDALEMKFSTFGKYYDAITDHEIEEYRQELIQEMQNKAKAKSKKNKNKT